MTATAEISASAAGQALLEARGFGKSFEGNRVLTDVDFAVRPG